MKISKCRNCKKKNLKKLFTLGNQYFTGKFIKFGDRVKRAPINLSICTKCKLVQLKDRYNLKYMYGPDYGYRTGINKTMSSHVKNITKYLSKKVNLKNKDFVLDIASNDGTLLNCYKQNVNTFGVDPILDKYKRFYKNINFTSNSFFSRLAVTSKTKKKFKIITALSVFYDLNDPNKFLKDVHYILDKNGLFLLEFADLASLIKLNMFDTICHEHAEYYSTKVLLEMFEKNNFKVIQINKNDINGASKQYLLSRKDSNFKSNKDNIQKILNEEKKLKLDDPKIYINFFKRIQKIGEHLKSFLNIQSNKGKIIHGYGASTKGNTLLQFFKIGRKEVEYISDRNPDKYGLKTPGTNITIISEKTSRFKKPDFYLVLPWHFKKEILSREQKIRKRGTKFIFPLPKLEII